MEKSVRTSEEVPKLDKVLPDEKYLRRLVHTECAYNDRLQPDKATSYIFESESSSEMVQLDNLLGLATPKKLQVGINPDYIRLFELGTPYAEAKEEPWRISTSAVVIKDCNGETQAVVMPMR
jgi:hypothetical protein